MKKLKLSELPIGSAEVLTREELKKVLGGIGSGSGGGGGTGPIFGSGGGSDECGYDPYNCDNKSCTVDCGDGTQVYGQCSSVNHSSECRCAGICVG